MKLIKYDYNPYQDSFSALERAFEDSFFGADRDSFFGRALRERPSSSMRLNVFEDESNYYVEAQLPGYDKESVNVELENSVLTITAEQKSKKDESDSVVRLNRSITVSDDVDAQKVTASLKHGLLEVTLPKAEERKPKSIKIS